MFRWLIPGLALMFAAQGGSADVRVTFHIGVLGMASLYKPATPAVELETAKAIAAKLSSRFPQWQYVPQPDLGDGYNLTGQVYSQLHDELILELVLLKHTATTSTPVQTWTETWIKPGGLVNGYPRREEAPQKIAAAVDALLLQKYSSVIFKQLMVVPLAIGGLWLDHWFTQEPRIVLPLKWPDRKLLGTSVFRVYCEWPDHPYTNLYSIGLGAGATADYPDDRYGAYPAIVVQPMRRRIGTDETTDRRVAEVLNELKKLKPKLIYLEEYKEDDLDIAGGNR